jgi:hypothetical protein
LSHFGGNEPSYTPRMLRPSICLLMCALSCEALPQIPAPPGISRPPAEPRVTALGQDDVNRDWQQYIRAPKTPIAQPIRIVSTSGNVKGAEALLTPGSARVAILTRTATDTEPTSILLDYGIEVGGVPSFDIAMVTGSPELRASYSEFLGYAGIDGDRAGTHSADPHRYDIYTVTRPGTITNPNIQGGERYQMISLTTSGSVSLRSATIQVTHYVASLSDYRGHFVCSDEGLNKIWYASAYTVQTNMLPTGSAVAPDATRNALPVSVDGAKRDRSVWSGDLVVQGPVNYYSTFATEYVRASLNLLGSNAHADGRVSTNLNAEWPVHASAVPSPHERIYSANYTLWWVRVLADYYRFTGDKKFLAEQWPTLTKELAWASTQLNHDGLFLTTRGNGLDWDYYGGPKVGAVKVFNAQYYGVLLDGAGMADALGEHDQATQYRSRPKRSVPPSTPRCSTPLPASMTSVIRSAALSRRMLMSVPSCSASPLQTRSRPSSQS